MLYQALHSPYMTTYMQLTLCIECGKHGCSPAIASYKVERNKSAYKRHDLHHSHI
jgi:hypothetical protein